MKKFSVLFLVFISSLTLNAQLVEEELLDQEWYTGSTASSNSGKWTRIATCTNTGNYQDFGTIFELFANGASNNTFFYGKLIARFKRQSSEPGPATSMALILYDSNIGAENIVGIRNGTTIDIYIRINRGYTRLFFRRLIRAHAAITPLKVEPFLSELPSGDYIINCKEGAVSSSNMEANSLIVNGTVEAEEIKVTNAPGADFVFSNDYPLRDLDQVEEFIKQNKHLPDIPSASQLEVSGVNLAEMNKLLLQKIEELTLYSIQQRRGKEELEKEVKKQSDKIKELNNINQKTNDRLTKIEAMLEL